MSEWEKMSNPHSGLRQCRTLSQSQKAIWQWIRPAFILLVLALQGIPGLAASLSGDLTDPEGNLVPGGTVRLLRRADSSTWEARTDTAGQFSFTPLEPGEYRLVAESPGFAPVTRTLVVPEGHGTAEIQFAGIEAQSASVTVSA